MVEFIITARGLYVRFQFIPETLLAMLILFRLWQRLS